MSLAWVAVDVGQLVINQRTAIPPYKAPQEGTFEMEGGDCLRSRSSHLFCQYQTRVVHKLRTPSDPEAFALYHLCPPVSDYRPQSLSHPPIPPRLV